MKVILKTVVLLCGLSLFVFVYLYAQMNEEIGNDEADLMTSPRFADEGHAYLQQNDFINAIKEFKKWKEIDESEQPLYWLGEAYYRLGDVNKAEEVLLKSLSINSDNLDAIDLLANVYLKQGKYKQGLEYLLKIKKALPGDDLVLLAIANLYIEIGRYQDAIQTVHECLKLNSSTEEDVADAYLILEDAYRVLGDSEKSIETLEKIKNINPNARHLYYVLGRIYYEVGDYSKALSYAKKNIKLRPQSGRGHLLLAKVYRSRGEEQLMNEALKKAIFFLRLRGQSPSKRDFLMALIYNDFDLKPKSALSYALDANKSIKSSYGYTILGWAYYRNQKYKESLKALTNAIDINPNNSHTWYRLGMTHKALGDIDSSLKAFEKAITLGPIEYHNEIKEEIKNIKKT